MKQILLTLSLGIVFFSSKAQTYEHYNYNRAGVPERTGYTKVVDNQPKFAPYRAPFDLNLYRESGEAYQRAIIAKQDLYNRNVKSLQDLFDIISQMNVRISAKSPDLGKSITELMNSYAQVMSTNKYDYSDEKVFRYWYNEIYKVYQDNFKFSQ